ncbi:protoporphyrinogen oxidase [Streptomyces liangshanensis]|uniref:Coproporphyrinogen III oxidase n=1 Tax=Streptomyces liangshanensis TaxID=2717324 RepID=A0A6G9GV48_9ACTN|nr:protoporphyrinogen oxidase [Streptomyces liangshanensis]QIQ02074.1 protoporphyrinogen oxidase [Streptomyces liangshanensis]
MESNAQHVSTHTGRVVVIGGGIAGLAAAHRLLGAGVAVTLLEGSGRLGGKLLTGEIEGVAVDLGAESMLARRPEAVGLAEEVGLGGRLQPPTAGGASVWTRGALRPMPKGHVMGVPGDAAALAGLLSDEGLARIAREPDLAPTEVGDDVSVGEYVAERLGREVVDRLVEPLLGGVYAGDAYRISMKAAVPQLFAAVRTHDSLLAGVRDLQAKAARDPRSGAVFAGLAGGVGTLPGAVADAVRAGGGEILLDTPVLGLGRTPDGWRIRTGTGVLTADGVVLATPAWSAATLLAAESPAASAELAAVEYASMALVTLAFRRDELAGMPEGSGFLVPPVDGLTIKASTFSTRKWGWVADAAPDLFLLRTSIGRYGEEEHLHRDDADLVDVSLRDLGEATGLDAKPVASEVTRWIGGLPQYPVGHQARVERVRAAVAELPGLRVCGAAYDGVGIPACVASARRAADEIIATSTLARGTGRGAGE